MHHDLKLFQLIVDDKEVEQILAKMKELQEVGK